MWGFGFYTKTYVFGNDQPHDLPTYIHSDYVHLGVKGYVVGLVYPLYLPEKLIQEQIRFFFSFFYFCDYNKYFNTHLLWNKRDYRLAGWLALFATLYSAAQPMFQEKNSVFLLKEKVYRHSKCFVCLWRYTFKYTPWMIRNYLAKSHQLTEQGSF